MRTTLTLEDSLVVKLRAMAQKRNVSFKAVVNEVLRNGLQTTAQRPKSKPFRVKPISMGVMPGIDYDKINQYLDNEDTERFIAKMKKER